MGVEDVPTCTYPEEMKTGWLFTVIGSPLVGTVWPCTMIGALMGVEATFGVADSESTGETSFAG